MAHTKSQGSSSNGRDSAGQRLGVKAFGDEVIHAGSIIVRQHGTKFHCGKNVKMGSDHTIFATATGKVNFEWKAKDRKYVNIVPVAAAKN